jgi:hypothetical protein
LIVNFVSSLVRLFRFGLTYNTILGFFVAIALVLTHFYVRNFALAVQDRVIRMEMRLRLAEILPAEMRSRIPEFTLGQLVALRFASDTELPGLAKKVLDEKLTDRKAIKQMVKDWQPDYMRA